MIFPMLEDGEKRKNQQAILCNSYYHEFWKSVDPVDPQNGNSKDLENDNSPFVKNAEGIVHKKACIWVLPNCRD